MKRRPTVISVANHKGGVLKTTLTANLGAALARDGYRVLLVDLDAQQNLTTSFVDLPEEEAAGELTLAGAILEGESLDHLVLSTNAKNLDLIPAGEDFAGLEISLVQKMARETLLRRAIANSVKVRAYDFVLIDNQPAISLVVVNALVASDFFLVPCSAEYLPMRGLDLLGRTIGQVQQIAPHLTFLGVVLTHYARNERVCRNTEAVLKAQLEESVFDTKIRVNTKGKSAPSVQKTIFQFENSTSGKGTQDFTALGAEVLRRIEGIETARSGGARKAVGNG